MTIPIITAPGIYPGVPAEVYHTPQLTPVPALSSTAIRDLLKTCPAVFRHKHLEPRPPVYKEEFDIGHAAHLLVLEPHLFAERVECIPGGYTEKGAWSDGWRTEDAKAKVAAARAAGKIPLKREQYDTVLAMRSALFQNRIAAMAFDPSQVVTEETRVWIDPETGVWCKSRKDAAARNGRWRIDYKTVRSAHPDDFARSVADYGYHIQAAHYLEGDAATGDDPPDAFAFVVQEKEPPYVVATYWLHPDWLAEGRQHTREARRLFAECLSADRWPGYEPADSPTYTLEVPVWLRRQIEDREAKGASVRDPRFATAFQIQSPQGVEA